ncbi:MAG: RebB like protein [Candidatus Scalindua sp.]|jgi:hypothetical protein|nr:RebB like protein [Candidatus Scalindua sp.]MBT5304739.1 RebB like protein [Candidatus Scalindua sp.]MBT6049538.1 RebB like protein [Candidatus Scalindua sp.]MBT6228147.1 RebB like protein [Candidatus Scalindua sp.]MBT6560993.1 RebB like protein [Candidatus Scalindua sp.]
MAEPTSVNSQITDSVTQLNLETIGSSPGQSLASLQQVLASTAGIAMQNAVSNQQNLNDVSAAAVTRCVNSLLGE